MPVMGADVNRLTQPDVLTVYRELVLGGTS
jgi:hypothetical protein